MIGPSIGAIAVMVAASTPAVVRRVLDAAGVAKLEISLALASKPERMLSRPSGEALRRSLQRISGAKGSVDDTALSALAALHRADGSAISHDTAAEEAWATAAELRVGVESLLVLFNPPEVTQLESPAAPLCGVPCTPFFSTRCCARPEVVLTWQCSELRTSEAGTDGTIATASTESSTWRDVGQGASFTPSIQYRDQLLRVVATPPALPHCAPLERRLVLGRVAVAPPRPVLEERLRALQDATGAAEFGVLIYVCLTSGLRQHTQNIHVTTWCWGVLLWRRLGPC